MLFYTENEFIKDKYHFFRCAESSNIYMHAHEFYEIAYVYDGIGYQYMTDGRKNIGSGSIVFMSPNTEHCIAAHDNDAKNMVWICNGLFTRQYFDDAVKEYLKTESVKKTEFYSVLKDKKSFSLCLKDNDYQSVKCIFQIMQSEYNRENLCDEKIMTNLLINLLVEISRIYDIQLGKSEPIHNEKQEIDILADYIDHHLEMDLTLEILAAQVHFSTYYLSRYFKKSTGKNITQYIKEKRVERAKKLLQSGNLSVGDVCYLCGFKSLSNFRKYFTETTGVSPNTYKKQKGI